MKEFILWARRRNAKLMLPLNLAGILLTLIIWNESYVVNSTFRYLPSSSLQVDDNLSNLHKVNESRTSTFPEGGNQTVLKSLSPIVGKLYASQNTSTTSLHQLIESIVLLGQFNFDAPFSSIQQWLEIWSKYFAKIVIAGPFSTETQKELDAVGIVYIVGRNDEGFVSPYENLLATMQIFRESNVSKNLATGIPSSWTSDVDGILYLHDDGLLNINRLMNGRKRLPTDVFISADYTHYTGPKPQMEYSIHVERERRLWPNGTEFSTVSPVYYFEHTPDDDVGNRTIHKTIVGLMKVLPSWPHMHECLRQQVKMLSEYDETWWNEFADFTNQSTVFESNSDASAIGNGIQHHDDNTSELVSRTSYRFSFPGYAQSDLLYVPLQYTDLIDRAAQPHIKNEVFLECAVPTIIHWVTTSALRQQKRDGDDAAGAVQIPVPIIEKLPLCTDFTNVRGKQRMLLRCLQASNDWGFYHPFKMRKVGTKMYSQWLEIVQQKPVTSGPKLHV